MINYGLDDSFELSSGAQASAEELVGILRGSKLVEFGEMFQTISYISPSPSSSLGAVQRQLNRSARYKTCDGEFFFAEPFLTMYATDHKQSLFRLSLALLQNSVNHANCPKRLFLSHWQSA